MAFLNRCIRGVALVGCCLLAAGAATAQVTTINSVKLYPREFNDDPTSVLTTVNNYPALISFDDESVDKNGQTGGFANRHVWRFSSDGGTTAYKFKNDDFFEVYMTVTLKADPISPRKEAGFIFDTKGGQGQFIVNTDAHEIVAFGGPLPFFAFPSTFQAGQTIQLGMTYFKDTDGKRKIIYHAGGVNSPVKEFTNLEKGIIDNSTLGGYMQVVIDRTHPTNFGMAEFRNINLVDIGTATVSGTVTLQDVTDAAVPLTFEFRPTDGSAAFTRDVVPSTNGTFSVTGLPHKNYTVHIKGAKWLAQNVAADASGGNVTGLNVTLLGGDADNNNIVDFDDLTILAIAYNTALGDSLYDDRADFNLDNQVEFADLTILAINYNLSGDP